MWRSEFVGVCSLLLPGIARTQRCRLGGKYHLDGLRPFSEVLQAVLTSSSALNELDLEPGFEGWLFGSCTQETPRLGGRADLEARGALSLCRVSQTEPEPESWRAALGVACLGCSAGEAFPGGALLEMCRLGVPCWGFLTGVS